MDFGAGRHVKESKVSDLSGTPLYLAPELFTGQAASPASDLYSLGVLLFYLVTGKHPVEGRTLTEIMLVHTKGNRTLLSDVRPDLPGRFVQVVERALASAPDQRFRTAGEMQHELIDAMPGASRSRHDTVSISSRGNVPAIGSDGLAREDRAGPADLSPDPSPCSSSPRTGWWIRDHAGPGLSDDRALRPRHQSKR